MGLREAAVAGALMVAVSLSGCGGGRRPEAPPTPISPNGEPLVGGVCTDVLGRWFDAADRNHDGFLDANEFMADTDRWFAVMDANHDGAVTPDELTALRLKLVPPKVPTKRGDDDGDEPERRRRGGLFGSGSDRPRGPGERPDPVMSADVNLDNRVTLEEFRAQAERVFAGLDRDHDGRLSKDEVMVGCPAEKR